MSNMDNRGGIRDKKNVKAFLVLLSILLLGFVFSGFLGDFISYPLNNSQIPSSFNLTIDINSISSALSSDVLNLYVNHNLVYSNTYTANGIYKIPFSIYSNGVYNFTIETSSNSYTDFYTYSNLDFSTYYSILNYYAIIIVFLGIGAIIYFLFRNSIMSEFILIFIFLFYLGYAISNPYTSSIYIEWLNFIIPVIAITGISIKTAFKYI